MSYFTCWGAHNFYGTHPWLNRIATSNHSISENIIGNSKSHTGTLTESPGCIPLNPNLFFNWTPTQFPPCYVCPCNFYHQQQMTSNGKDNNRSIHTQTELSLLNPNPNTELFLLEEIESSNEKPYRYFEHSLSAPRDCQYLAEKIKLSFQEIEALKIRKQENKDYISSGSEPDEIEDTYVFGISDSPLYTSSNRDPRERKTKISVNKSPSHKILPKRHVSKVSINYFFDENGMDLLRRRDSLRARDTPEQDNTHN